MTKNQINDFGARNDFDVNERDNKPVMIKELIKQIEKRTGQKVRWFKLQELPYAQMPKY